MDKNRQFIDASIREVDNILE